MLRVGLVLGLCRFPEYARGGIRFWDFVDGLPSSGGKLPRWGKIFLVLVGLNSLPLVFIPLFHLCLCCDLVLHVFRWIRSDINMSDTHSRHNELGSHSPSTAAIQRAESTRDLSDPEGKPVKTFDKAVEIAEKDQSGNRDASIDGGSMKPTYDHTRRKLKPRHLQLIGIGGTIGTALYVQIGNNLRTSGPASLFLGFSLW